MNGHYIIGLAVGQEPNEHPMVRKLLRMINPGAQVDIQVYEDFTHEQKWHRWCKITATGGGPAKSTVGADVRAYKANLPSKLTKEQCRKELESVRSGDYKRWRDKQRWALLTMEERQGEVEYWEACLELAR